MRVVLGFLGGDPALVDKALYERVVMGDHPQFAVAEQVGAGVTNVRDVGELALEEHRGERRPHALEVRFGLDPGGDAAVGVDGGLAECAQRFGVAGGVERPDRRDRDGAGDVATHRAAHAVGDGKQVRTGVAGVLVPRLGSESDVGVCGVSERERHPAFSWP